MIKSKKSLLIGFLIAGVAFYIWQRRDAFTQILSVLALSGVFTLILTPACNYLEKKHIPPAASAAAVLSGFLLAALFALSLFIPLLLTRTVSLLQRNIPTLLSVLETVQGISDALGFQALSPDISSIPVSSLSAVTAFLARAGKATAASIGRVFFAFIITYYPLQERNTLGRHILLCMPLAWRASFLSIVRACKTAISGYLSGMLKTSLFISAATWAGLLMLGIKDAALLAFFMGVFELFPYIGPVLASIPILLSALEQGTQQALLALALVIAIQQIESNFISPYFTASSTSLHPFTALLSVFIFGSLMGLWGVLLAVPAVITFRSVLLSLRQTYS